MDRNTNIDDEQDEEFLMSDKEQNSPAVIAYRVGQLEKKQTAGFSALNKKIDDFMQGFVTKKDFESFKIELKEDELARQVQRDKDDLVRDNDIKALKDFKDKIVSRLALGAVLALIAMVLAMYGLNQLGVL